MGVEAGASFVGARSEETDLAVDGSQVTAGLDGVERFGQVEGHLDGGNRPVPEITKRAQPVEHLDTPRVQDVRPRRGRRARGLVQDFRPAQPRVPPAARCTTSPARDRDRGGGGRGRRRLSPKPSPSTGSAVL